MRNATCLHPTIVHRKRHKDEIENLKKFRQIWLKQIDSGSLFFPLFDYLPGVFFFAKDGQGRTMIVSQGILDLYQMQDESQMLGLTDFDINPDQMADQYVSDDSRILSAKIDKLERMELWFNGLGLPEWYLVTKLPIIDSQGERIGVMGMLRKATESELRHPLFRPVSEAVNYIRREFHRELSIEEVAKVCHTSIRHLQRQFQTVFGLSPKEFLLRTRVANAARLLEQTSLPISQIATTCGFVDSSSFSLHFRKRMKLTPTEHRQQGREHS